MEVTLLKKIEIYRAQYQEIEGKYSSQEFVQKTEELKKRMKEDGVHPDFIVGFWDHYSCDNGTMTIWDWLKEAGMLTEEKLKETNAYYFSLWS